MKIVMGNKTFQLVEDEHTCEHSGVTFPTSGSSISRKRLGFGEALVWLRKGYSVSRSSWKSSEIYVWIEGKNVNHLAYLNVKTSGNNIVPWSPNHGDLLASDWFVR